LTEISGVVTSRRQPGVVWAHEDSGQPAELTAMTAAGATLGRFTWAGATNVDWEDLAIADDVLYLADIGDNQSTRTHVTVYRVPEPEVDPTGGDTGLHVLTGVDAVDLTYPDGAHDAETLLADPVTGDVFIVTKIGSGAGVYRLPSPFGADGELALVRTLDGADVELSLATGGDISPAGDGIVLLSYLGARLWPRHGGTVADAFAGPPCAVPSAGGQQEAIGFTSDGHGYVTISEVGIGGVPPVPVRRFDQVGPWPFADVDPAAWYEPAVRRLTARGVVTGFGGGRFDPRSGLTRGQAAGWLWRLAGSPDAPPEAFADVRDGAWYAPAVGWVVSEAIASGYADLTFRPRTALRRGAAAAWLSADAS
jgi:hypothetical protein